MNYRFTVMALVLLLSACSANLSMEAATPAAPAAASAATTPVTMPAAPPAASPPTQDQADQLLEAYLSAWNAHDIQGAGAYLHDGIAYMDVSVGEIQRGRQAAEDNVIGVLMRAMPDLTWELRGDPIIQGDGVAYEWTLTGTNTGTWSGIPASGQKVNIKGTTIMRIKDGKIAYQADYYDVASLNRQLGWN
jgi:steroid delta-isomerase-like uncharacterized protein